MASTAAAMIAKAASQVGVREGRDPNGNWNNRQPYGTWYADAIGNQAFAAVAWCDIFISWCAHFSGNADIIGKSAWVPGRLAHFRSLKRTGYFPPQPGDLGIVLDSRGSAQHIFLVEKWLGDGLVQTIEGNTNTSGSAQGNGVYRLQRRDWSDNPGIVYCRPQYAAAPPTMSKPVAGPASKPTAKPAAFNYAPVAMSMTKGIDLSALRPGKTNAHVARLESAIWNWRGMAFRKQLVKAYGLTRRAQLYDTHYGKMLTAMVGDSYRLLDELEPRNGWLTEDQRKGKKPLPTWPGPAFLRRIGFKTVYES